MADYKLVGNINITGDIKINGSKLVSMPGIVADMILAGETPPSPTLNDNSWGMIKTICEAGLAGNFWSVGDTKSDVGTDGKTRTFRIVDMSGLYGKHVVFEQTAKDTGSGSTDYWNATSNTDDDGACNNYSISDIRTRLNSTVKGYYSSSLQNALTKTTVKVAKNGTSSTVLEVEDYLFLAAAKEIGADSNATNQENSALTRFQWFQTNTSRDYKNLGSGWTLRSPKIGETTKITAYDGGGYEVSLSTSSYCNIVAHFAF